MRNIRRRNWFLKRIVLGFAVAALVVPAAAQARVDEGINGQPNWAAEITNGSTFVPFVTDFPKYETTVKAGDYELLEKNRGEPSTVVTPQLVSSPGFDWGDAGIGAALAIGLVLLGGAAFRLTRHLGEAQTANG
jgi:hypothetical protein